MELFSGLWSCPFLQRLLNISLAKKENERISYYVVQFRKQTFLSTLPTKMNKKKTRRFNYDGFLVTKEWSSKGRFGSVCFINGCFLILSLIRMDCCSPSPLLWWRRPPLKTGGYNNGKNGGGRGRMKNAGHSTTRNRTKNGSPSIP